jgi:hypothetical protein
MAEEKKEIVVFELRVDDGGKSAPEAKKEVDALATSILGLQQANKKLREERKLLDTSTAEGTKRIKEINEAIDKNDKTIKNNSSSLEKQRLNIGNYTGALDKLIPGLGATANGFGAMTKAAWAFVANPIGAVIAALALALMALTKYFTGSEEGADKFAKVSAQVSAVVGVVTERLIQLGGALVAFLSGDFEGGVDKLSGAFSGLGDEMEREIALAAELTDILDMLEEMELRHSLAVSESKNQIKQLIIESKNRTLSENERLAKLQEAIELEKKLNGEALALQQARISATARQVEADFSQVQSAQQVGETTLEFAKRIIENEDILFSRREELAELLKSYNETQGESLALQEKLSSQEDALEEKRLEQMSKREAERVKLADKERNDRIARLEADRARIQDDYNKKIAFDKAFYQNKETIIKDFNTRIAAEQKLRTEQEAENKKKEVEINKIAEQSKFDAVRQSIELSKGAVKQGSIAYKLLATSGIIIDTYRAAAAALAPPPIGAGPVLGPILAGVTIASGFANIAKVNAVQFAQGGNVGEKRGTFRGPSHSKGGIDYISSDGRHRINVEGDENFYVLKKSASSEINRLSDLNVKHGGVSWSNNRHPVTRHALGGAVVSPSQGIRPAEIERIVASTVANMPPIYTVATEVESVLSDVNRIKNKATIIGG